MALRYKLLEEITEQDLLDLVTNEVGEGRYLEYKQELKYDLKQDKVDLLAEVVSFANSEGGDIIFGIKEDRATGIPKEVCGLQIENEDKVIRMLETSIQDGLDPRLPYIRFRVVPLPSKKASALIIRVGRSLAGPHMIDFDKVCRFYGRNSKGKFIMDARQVRTAVEVLGTLGERVRRFREERLAKIREGDTPVSMPIGAKLVMHLIPFTAFDPGFKHLDLRELPIKHTELRQALVWGGGSNHKYNFDGHLTFSTVPKEAPYKSESYLQVFNEGIIEAVDSTILAFIGEGKIIPVSYEKYLLEGMSRYSKLLSHLSITPPFLIMLSFLEVKNFKVGGSPVGASEPIDRSTLLLPEVLLENDIFDISSLAILLRSSIDRVWNASGRVNSPNFDDEGNWKFVG